MPRASFGLILANRAVVLGAIRRAISSSCRSRPRARAPSTPSGSATACSPSRASSRWRCSRRSPAPRSRMRLGGGLHGHLRPPPSRAARAAVGEPRRALGRPGAGSPSAWAGPTSASAAQALEHAAMGIRAERARGPAGGGHRRSCASSSRASKVSHQGELLSVRGRELEPQPGPAAVPDLDREQPDRPHLEGRRQRLRRRRRARASGGSPATPTAG